MIKLAGTIIVIGLLLRFDNNKLFIIGDVFKQINFFRVLNIYFAHENVHDVEAKGFVVVVLVFLHQFFLHVFYVGDAFHHLLNIFSFPNFVEIDLLELALNNEHTLIILEVKVIFGVKCLQLINIHATTHFREFLLLSYRCLFLVMTFPHF